MFDNIPQEMKIRKQWVCWRQEDKKKADRAIEKTKIPYIPLTNTKASVSNDKTWREFSQAVESVNKGLHDGIGFVFRNDPYFGIDLDNCVNQDGTIEQWALDILKRGNTYTEFSVSGNGLHSIGKGKLADDSPHTKKIGKGKFEIYDRKRFFCMTGNLLDGYPTTIEERQKQVNQICEDIFGKPEPKEPSSITTLTDQKILAIMRNSKQREKFIKLFDHGDISDYPSGSEADLALVSIIAFYTQDKGQLLSIIKQSALHDDKWEREDYQRRTIDKALSNLTKTYNPSQLNKRSGTMADDNIQVIENIAQKLIIPFNLTDYGNAERLVYYHGDNIRYCEPMKSWFIWDGNRWKPDDCLAIDRLAKDTVRRIYAEAGNSDNEKQRKDIADHAKRSEANNKIQAMVSLARSESDVIIRPDDLDRDGFLLNCENGTIDLRTGELLAHRKTDNITKIIPVSYDKMAECQRWELFLKEIFKEDKDLITFIKYAVGYSLTGSMKEECLFICYGTGRNGKSKFLDTLEFIFGDYGRNVDPSTFEERKKDGSAASEDIARLKDARFISTIETAEGRRLSESLIKKMTGDKIILARELYKSSFQFEQKYKVWLATNHKPIIRGLDNAIWDRIKLIPFEVYFSEEKRDKDLLQKLIAEAPGILNWAVEGCLLWQGVGLYLVTQSSKVKDATKDYRTEMDLIGEFLTEKCIKKDDITISKQLIYNTYIEWCKESGIQYPETKIKFGRKLKDSHDIKDDSATDNISIWKGLGLKLTI